MPCSVAFRFVEASGDFVSRFLRTSFFVLLSCVVEPPIVCCLVTSCCCASLTTLSLSLWSYPHPPPPAQTETEPVAAAAAAAAASLLAAPPSRGILSDGEPFVLERRLKACRCAGCFGEQQRGVGTTKSKGVRRSDVDRACFRFTSNEAQLGNVCRGARIVEVQRWRHDVLDGDDKEGTSGSWKRTQRRPDALWTHVDNRQDGKNRFNCPCSSEEVPNGALPHSTRARWQSGKA